MNIFRRLAKSAPQVTGDEPFNFCDVCGRPVYKTDVIVARVTSCEVIAHGTCAEMLEHELFQKRMARSW